LAVIASVRRRRRRSPRSQGWPCWRRRRGRKLHWKGISPKSGKGRKVPIPAVLRDYLDEHVLNLPWDEGFIFAATAATA